MERAFLRFCLLYFIIAVTVTAYFSGGEVSQVTTAVSIAVGYFNVRAIGFGAVLILLSRVAFGPSVDGKLRRGLVMVASMLVFLAAFHMLKSFMPLARPFSADPILAEADRYIHFGVDPWQLTQLIVPYVSVALMSSYYTVVWVAISIGFPIFLVMFDHDTSRQARFLLLFLVIWVGLGNLLAMAFPAAGPIYFDRLYGGTTFQGLHEALANNGLAASIVGRGHDFLWEAYVNGYNQIGSGISAYPSIHVAMAMLISIYLLERSRYFAPLALFHTATNLVLSVHLGWHYAIDGYVAIVLVFLGWWACWIWQRRTAAIT